MWRLCKWACLVESLIKTVCLRHFLNILFYICSRLQSARVESWSYSWGKNNNTYLNWCQQQAHVAFRLFYVAERAVCRRGRGLRAESNRFWICPSVPCWQCPPADPLFHTAVRRARTLWKRWIRQSLWSLESWGHPGNLNVTLVSLRHGSGLAGVMTCLFVFVSSVHHAVRPSALPEWPAWDDLLICCRYHAKDKRGRFLIGWRRLERCIRWCQRAR